jgi:hypothetical protein
MLRSTALAPKALRTRRIFSGDLLDSYVRSKKSSPLFLLSPYMPLRGRGCQRRGRSVDCTQRWSQRHLRSCGQLCPQRARMLTKISSLSTSIGVCSSPLHKLPPHPSDGTSLCELRAHSLGVAYERCGDYVLTSTKSIPERVLFGFEAVRGIRDAVSHLDSNNLRFI